MIEFADIIDIPGLPRDDDPLLDRMLRERGLAAAQRMLTGAPLSAAEKAFVLIYAGIPYRTRMQGNNVIITTEKAGLELRDGKIHIATTRIDRSTKPTISIGSSSDTKPVVE